MALRRTPLSPGSPVDKEGRRRYSTLAPGKPLRRTRMRRRPARRVAKRRHLRPWLAFVAKHPCAGELGVYIEGRGWREHFCEGPIQVMHLGPKPGVGLKCSDLETGAGCLALHLAFDGHKGPFAGLSRDERRTWADKVIHDTRLSAIPTTIEEAWELARLGLGEVLKEIHGQGWCWKPLGATTERAA